MASQKTKLNEFEGSIQNEAYQSYSEYVETENEFLNSIPRHWETSKIKYMFDRIESGTTPKRSNDDFYDGDIGWVNIEDLNDGYVSDTEKKITEYALEKNTGLEVYPEGTLLMAIYGSIGKLGILDFPSTTNQACVALINPKEEIMSKYVFYTLFALREDLIKASYGGVQDNISQGIVKNFKLYRPPVDEQESIVEFLDKETEKIHNLIDKKEDLIRLLKEKRAATINRLVTSGVNNDPKEQIELDWFNTIPTSWETTSLRNTVDKFVDYRGATPEKSDSGITLITAKNIDDGHLDFTEDHEYVSEEVYEEWMTRGYPEEGDVLITTEAPMGEVAQVEDTPVALAQRIILLKPNTDLVKKGFLKYFLESEFNQTQLMKSQTGSTAKGIQASKLKGIRVLIPPLAEQEKILEEIEQEIEKIDELISEIEGGIERLKEYRTALITEAVTGQIDVRGEV